MKKLLFTIFGAVTLFSATAQHLNDRLLLTAKLTGDQESPAVTTDAVGIASLLLNGNHDSLCLNITVTGMSGAITGAMIHSGEPGTNGAVVKDLTASVKGNTIKTVITGADLSTHLKEYLSGKLYINIHTNAHANGEIRGQIYLETDWSFTASLNGSELVPVSSTTAYGLGVFNLSKDSSKILYTVVLQNISGPLTQARLNFGAKGLNGSLAVDLTPAIKGNAIAGVINNPAANLIDSLIAGKIYIDLSTATNTSGKELRGQLSSSLNFLYFDAFLNGLQEVPTVPTAAVAVASIKLSPAMDTVWYDIVSTGLSGVITDAHFHLGAPGIAGGAVVNIGTGISGNKVSGKIFGSSLTADFIKNLLKGDLYVNLHTALNPNGEIRGQVYRLARQGYVASLEGAQQVPPVVTKANGEGIVSISRDGDNAHFMIVTDSITATMIHFHKQVAGQNGGVIFDLMPYYMNNRAFGFWKATNTSPFTTAIANVFFKDSVYILSLIHI